MSEEKKEIKLKRINAWIVYDNLRSIPPKEFDTVGQIKTLMNGVLPAFKSKIKEHIDMMTDFRAFNQKAIEEKMPQHDLEKKVAEVNKIWSTYNKEHGKEVVTISLDKEAMSVLTTLFNKYGNKMFNTIEEFVEVEEAISKTGE